MSRLALAALLLALAAPARAADGRSLFVHYCAVCHGEDGRGHTGTGRRMGLKDLAATRLSTEDIELLVVRGRGKMPSFRGTFTLEEIRAVAAAVKHGLW